MGKRIGILTFIFVCTTVGWAILGTATGLRTYTQDVKLRGDVGRLWGTVQKQQAPHVYYRAEGEPVTMDLPMILGGSDIKVNIELEHRKRGLLWYSTYHVTFSGKYIVTNTTGEERDIFFEYKLPTEEGIYDNFSLAVDGEKLEELQPVSGRIHKKLTLEPDEEKKVEIAYRSQGMDKWWYVFGEGISQIRNFKLTMMTNFDDIDFPVNSISPTRKQKQEAGWELTWEYENLISGIQIGMEMPRKLNPGPFVSKVTFFAPVSLFLFLFLMFIITTVKRIEIHSVNYFFISASFFSFHLLMAYLVDHVNIYMTFVICSIVSIFLVISYMRLVLGLRFALFQTGLSQFVYLVFFSYTFFLEGYTGLAITILCIVTLFIVMQLTGRIVWDKHLPAEKEQQK